MEKAREEDPGEEEVLCSEVAAFKEMENQVNSNLI